MLALATLTPAKNRDQDGRPVGSPAPQRAQDPTAPDILTTAFERELYLSIPAFGREAFHKQKTSIGFVSQHTSGLSGSAMSIKRGPDITLAREAAKFFFFSTECALVTGLERLLATVDMECPPSEDVVQVVTNFKVAILVAVANGCYESYRDIICSMSIEQAVCHLMPNLLQMIGPDDAGVTYSETIRDFTDMLNIQIRGFGIYGHYNSDKAAMAP